MIGVVPAFDADCNTALVDDAGATEPFQLTDAETGGADESLTVSVADIDPVLDGIPEISPEPGSIARPAGRFDADHTYGAVPPEALRLAE
jgi:hypothetical protein